ncbi:MAG: acyl-homoserine-lactone synthase [Sphingomonas sp.]
MTQRIDTTSGNVEPEALRAMFAARKDVFVDLLHWKLEVREGCLEIDQFDDQHARYLILLDGDGRHLASARLLPTTRPHILDTMFPDLAGHDCPRSPHILEITRFCLDRRLRANERRQARDQLITMIVEHGLEHGVTSMTGVAELPWYQQIMAFGWRCAALGQPQTHDGQRLAALEIAIDRDTPARLARTGVWSPAHVAAFAGLAAGAAR